VRAIWKGAVSFGLVNVPVRLFAATQEHDIRFHQVHRADGGRIRMKRTCSVCGEEVSYDQLGQGLRGRGRPARHPHRGRLRAAPARHRARDRRRRVRADRAGGPDDVRPLVLPGAGRRGRSSPYALLREALNDTERMAVVKVALRQRESLAVLRVRDK
jgi:DNA end-binding protein Ku